MTARRSASAPAPSLHSSIKEAAYALAAMGPEGIAILTNAVQRQTEWSGMCAIQVLGLFHTDAGHVIPALTNALASPNSSVRRDAVRALGQFGPQAAAAAPLLQSLTNDPAVRLDALHALKNIQPSTARSEQTPASRPPH